MINTNSDRVARSALIEYSHNILMDWRAFIIRMGFRFGPILFVIVSYTAFFIGIIYHSINIDELKFNQAPTKHFDSNVIIGDRPDDLIWFLQVTDLHISYKRTSRRDDFAQFAKNYVDIFEPLAVLVTGDITDGIVPNTLINTGLQLGEWQNYSRAINESGNRDKTLWLDIRGNHDNVDVHQPKDANNYFRLYSVQGPQHARSYMHSVEKFGKNYTFIGVDELFTPGLKLPFNFLGLVEEEDLAELRRFKAIAGERRSQVTIWFAHYPTSAVVSPLGDVRDIFDGPYLCGHFHSIGGIEKRLHASQEAGFAEVELEDWKINRKVRLAAVDHQLFSLVDFKYQRFPIALMTNPKTAEHAMPKYEPLGRMINSTHIRVIAFSNATITSVEVSIDERPFESLKLVEKPLYVVPWNPKEYSTGLHKAQIRVTDSEGKTQIFEQNFSMDNQKAEPSIIAKIFLRPNLRWTFMCLFYFLMGIWLLPLIILRIYTYEHRQTSFMRHYKGTLLHRLHLLTKVPRIYWPLVSIPIWILVGPLTIGYFLKDTIGICFLWGIYIDGKFLPTATTYSSTTLIAAVVLIPNTILISNQVYASAKSTLIRQKPVSIINCRLLLCILLSMIQCFLSSLVWSAYGLLSLITSMLYFWSLVIIAICWYQCTKLSRDDFYIRSDSLNVAEEQHLTGSKRDDKSSNSDQSTC